MQAIHSSFPLVVSLVVLLNFLAVSAEEKSILNDAKLSSYDVNFDLSWNKVAAIDGNFKSLLVMKEAKINLDGSKEIQIILSEEQRIVLAYV